MAISSSRVLVVDDMMTMRAYERAILEGAGYVVEEAVNGLEALEKVLGEPYDLLLVDINMPKMDGYRFLRELRREESGASIPVIMISTEGAALDKEKAFLAGANLYLVKPVQPDMLIEAVRLMTGRTH